MTRHARWGHLGAGILLGGFILVEPPVSMDASTSMWAAKGSAPVKEWTHVSAYDTADACQQGRDDRIADAPDDLGESAERDKPGSKLGAAWDARIKSRCVPDSELFPDKAKPAQ